MRAGGSLKGLERVGDARIIDRVALALAKVCDQLIVAANDTSATDWLHGVPVVRDRFQSAGGLAGVDAALHWSQSSGPAGVDVLVVAWDMPFVTAGLLEALIEAAGRTDASVVVPESHSPYGIEPFCGWYSGRLAAALAAYVSPGGGPARDFLAGVAMHRLPLADVKRHGDPNVLLMSVNTEDDLERARRLRPS
jgi:molybdenum cofactor guanylyltransferase